MSLSLASRVRVGAALSWSSKLANNDHHTTIPLRFLRTRRFLSTLQTTTILT
jgi:hypothetical protein